MDSAVNSVTQVAPIIQEVLHFDIGWCEKFFRHSGDLNVSLHSPEKRAIVQGMAILTMVGTLISKHFPGYMVIAFKDKLEFKKPVHIGNNVVVEMQRLDNRKHVTEVAIKLLLNDAEITNIIVRLAAETLLDRGGVK